MIKTIEGIKAAVEVHKKAIEISAVLGAEIIIIHPSSITDAKGNYELLYSHLLPVAKKNNIKIAAENMFVRLDGALNIVPGACGTPEDFVHYIDYISDTPVFPTQDRRRNLSELSATSVSAHFIFIQTAVMMISMQFHFTEKQIGMKYVMSLLRLIIRVILHSKHINFC